MGVKLDLRDVLQELDGAPAKVGKVLHTIGEDAVGYAKERGDYQDRTGRLRKGNEFLSDERHLIVENDVEYASHVEHRGYDVLSGAEDYVRNKYDLKEQ